jgi:hypothetical protein
MSAPDSGPPVLKQRSWAEVSAWSGEDDRIADGHLVDSTRYGARVVAFSVTGGALAGSWHSRWAKAGMERQVSSR